MLRALNSPLLIQNPHLSELILCPPFHLGKLGFTVSQFDHKSHNVQYFFFNLSPRNYSAASKSQSSFKKKLKYSLSSLHRNPLRGNCPVQTSSRTLSQVSWFLTHSAHSAAHGLNKFGFSDCWNPCACTHSTHTTTRVGLGLPPFLSEFLCFFLPLLV